MIQLRNIGKVINGLKYSNRYEKLNLDIDSQDISPLRFCIAKTPLAFLRRFTTLGNFRSMQKQEWIRPLVRDIREIPTIYLETIIGTRYKI